ncbi:hypothetical protein SAMN05444392_101686 [Seinonella peptonophila]|uniref:Uncharacterized protein n=1 Tax=Seinonella peptonophila TaxID=112248 RepID=A0A1M4TX16_9BACL|nr:hypothetical protein [Seinonella peptonophila]SHE48914.1 hypothetical protein SAMN05444392_101686 [Seinonella peptonophila]
MIAACGWTIETKKIKEADKKIKSGWHDTKDNKKELAKIAPWLK